MSCCSGMIKCLLFLFNILFWIAGGVVLGLGIYLIASDDVSMAITVGGINVTYAGSYVLISAGAIMFVVGFFGCCGAIKESKCLLVLYFICLLIIFILEMGVGIWALVMVNQGTYDETLRSSLESHNPILYEGKSSSYSQSVVSTENNFKCCGTTNGCEDWTDGVAYGCGCETKDDTCGTPKRGCSADPLMPSSTYIYTEPCYNSIYEFIKKNLTVIAGVALGIGLAEIIGMIFSMIMVCNIKEEKENKYY